MSWKKPLGFVLTAVLAALLTMQTAYSLPGNQGGKGKLSPEAASLLKSRNIKTVPQFRAGLSNEAKSEAIARIDSLLSKKAAPAAFHASVRQWQSMSQSEKSQVLSGPVVLANGAVIAVMVVAAAAYGYYNGRRLADGDEFQDRRMTPNELDSLDPGPSQRAQVATAHHLDYGHI